MNDESRQAFEAWFGIGPTEIEQEALNTGIRLLWSVSKINAYMAWLYKETEKDAEIAELKARAESAETRLAAIDAEVGPEPSDPSTSELLRWLRNRNEQLAAQNVRMVKALDRTQRLIDEALPKFNWGASALDANAIQLLNEVPREVSEALAANKVQP